MSQTNYHATTPGTSQYLTFELLEERPDSCIATIIIPSFFVDTIYKEAARSQKKAAQTHGFNRASIPLEYIEHNYQSNLLEHTKEFLFKFFVISFLYKELRARKFRFIDEPRLIDIEIQPHQDAHFTFELTLFPQIIIQEWKYFPFKPPRRKKYKDLDRQVELFIKEERQPENEATKITIGDWVNFDIALADHDNCPLLGNYKENLWLKIGDEEVDSVLHEIFIDKKIGDSFFTTNRGLQEFFDDQIDTNYNFHISIIDIIPNSFFCLEQFKQHFKLKTNKEVHHKLIEVFSYRNDLSQRRTTVEEVLKLLLSKHHFTVPHALTLRQQKNILNIMHHNPDYHVYKLQRDFKDQVQRLAEKQLKETILLDQLSYHENIIVSHHDIKTYLNLTKRPRMKEFLYFDLPKTKIMGQEVPIITENLKQSCLREKILNYIIYYLTKG